MNTNISPAIKDKFTFEVDGQKYLIRIRKLTPRECWRLMGFSKQREDGSWDDGCFEKAEAVVSNTQLYRQAGNSIIVDILEHIFAKMFAENQANAIDDPIGWLENVMGSLDG